MSKNEVSSKNLTEVIEKEEILGEEFLSQGSKGRKGYDSLFRESLRNALLNTGLPAKENLVSSCESHIANEINEGKIPSELPRGNGKSPVLAEKRVYAIKDRIAELKKEYEGKGYKFIKKNNLVFLKENKK